MSCHQLYISGIPITGTLDGNVVPFGQMVYAGANRVLTSLLSNRDDPCSIMMRFDFDLKPTRGQLINVDFDDEPKLSFIRRDLSE